MRNLFSFPTVGTTCSESEPLCKTKKTICGENNNGNQQPNNNIQPSANLATLLYSKSTIKAKNKNKESK